MKALQTAIIELYARLRDKEPSEFTIDPFSLREGNRVCIVGNSRSEQIGAGLTETEALVDALQRLVNEARSFTARLEAPTRQAERALDLSMMLEAMQGRKL